MTTSIGHTVRTNPERVMVLWIPDWPLHAIRHTLSQNPAEPADHTDPTDSTHATVPPAVSDSSPLALVANRRIVVCCAQAREAGVRAGMRERDAQAICPALELHPHDPDRDARSFAPVISALEQIVTGLETRRPGLTALRARGPARYYGGEPPAAHAVLDCVRALGFVNARVGIADGLFTAEQAARATGAMPTNTASGFPDQSAIDSSVTIVSGGEARAFLSHLPIARAAGERLASTLQGLGIHTLGAFAALPEEAVRQRFGGEGLTVHRRATASGPQHGSEVRPRAPQPEFAVEAEFEPPLNASAALVEAATSTVARFFDTLTESALICTGLRLELTDDVGARHERTWSHSSRFSVEDVLDRVRWQAESGTLNGASSGTSVSGVTASEERGGAGVTRLRITPTHTDRARAAELWGAEPDDRVRHHLRGIQLTHGKSSIGTSTLRGGRLAAQRQQFTPWGSRPSSTAHPAGLPWPGAAPAPSLVFPSPLSAAFVDADGELIRVDTDDLLSSDPAHLTVRGTVVSPDHFSGLPRAGAVTSWSAPWPLRERWWDGAPPRVRLQVVLSTGDAWLLIHDTGRWFAEGRYD